MASPRSNFAFFSVSGMLFSPGGAHQLATFTRGGLGPRVLLVTDATIRRLGLCQPVLDALAGSDVTIFDAVEADPKVTTVEAAVRAARENKVTGVVGLGGGSSLDVAKAAALLAGSGQTLDEVWGVNNAKGPRLPLALIPTTAGTGSEATPVAIFTLPNDEKRGVSTSLNIPDWAILDPDLTAGLPPHITAMTGLDAAVHAIEAFVSANANNNPLSRLLAKEALSLLCGNIGAAVSNGHDGEARSAMLLGSYMAGQAFANSPVSAVHALAYPIGGGFHVPHGLSTALMLPHVMRFNQAADPLLYAELAVASFPNLASIAPEGRGEAFVQALDGLRQEIGLVGRLRDVGIGEDHLAGMARDAMQQQRLLVNNPRPLTEQDALDLYRAAW
ncbi:iron-containing alcohol dehydrogenase [Devosia oryzisoli]